MGSPQTIEALLGEIAALTETLERRDRRAARERALLHARLGALAEQVASETERSKRLRAALTEAGADLQQMERRGRSLEAEVAARGSLAERLAAQTEVLRSVAAGVHGARGDVERVGGSTAWRVGHALVRVSDRLRMRRRVTPGAVATALERLAGLERDLTELLSEGGGTGIAPGRVGGGPTIGAGADPRPREARGASADPRSPGELDADGLAALAGEIRSRLGPAPRRLRLPMVSIVVLNRNGHHHLVRLLEGLATRTDYPQLELIVVDNGSSDGSRQYLRAAHPSFGLAVIENDENASFAVGNRQGARRARGELLLFLNNDVEPFESGWLKELVALGTRPGVGAAGATLLYAGELMAGVPSVQHRGVRLRTVRDRLVPYNLDNGAALFGERFGVDVDAPATTGACLLVGRELFDSLGGFPDGYRYGTEDVDLSLQIVAAGSAVVTSGRAHLLHRESSTQDAEGREFKRRNRLDNQQLFAARWGSRLRREYRTSRLRGEGYWTDGEHPHIAITLTSADPADGWGDWYTGHELGDALARIGWRVTYIERREDAWYTLPDGLDYLLVLLDAFDPGNVWTEALKIAWVRNWTERWIERESFGLYDLVLASSRQSAALIEEQTAVKAIQFPLATNPERFWRVAEQDELRADAVFTGNRWSQPRAIESLRAGEGETLRVFGRGWDQVPGLADYTHGPVPYEQLPAVYSSADVVIDDCAGHALPYGAVNSRVFDALACGTVVASNCESGVRDLFDDEFPTWRDAASLRQVLDELRADPRRRDRLVRRYQRIVRDRHTYEHRARELTAVLQRSEERLSFCLKTGAPDRSVAAEWGDVHFAEALARELRRRGHRAIVQTLDEWEELAGTYCDVAVHLKGLSRYVPKPGQYNVLWCISHPDKLTTEECEAYDLVCVASSRFAAELRECVSRPVVVLEQATDPRVFYPEADARYAHELLFVANSRKVMRRIMSDLLPTDRGLAVYGTNWGGLIDDRYIAGEHIPNRELRRAYSSAAIVLNDHWDDMRDHGFVSNRIYDALACGAVVLSDELPELHDRFDDAVVTYTEAGQLPGLIESLLRRPEERAERGRRGRRAVLAAHTFSHRVDELLAILGREIPEPRLVAAGRRPWPPPRTRSLIRPRTWRRAAPVGKVRAR